MKKNVNSCLIFILFVSAIPYFGYCQLGFCGGNSGTPVFTEDFGSGTTNGPALPSGVTTYSYVATAPDDNEYTIASTTNYFDWFNTEDHTPDDMNGKALVVNASFTAGDYYTRAITGLCGSTTYEFSVWVLNLKPSNAICDTPNIPINVKLQAFRNGETTVFAEGATGDILSSESPEWFQYALVFKTNPGQTSVILNLKNNRGGGCGNDLAIDDISLKSCGDAVTLRNTDNEVLVLICEDESTAATTLTATPDFTVFSTHNYQWEQSVDGSTWVNLAGATNASLAIPPTNTTTFYRAKVAEDVSNVNNNLCNVISDAFEVRVVPIPQNPVSNGDVARCVSESVPLVVSVPTGVTVDWYNSITGGRLLLKNSTSYVPIVQGTYYAEAVSLDLNCGSNGRTPVTLTINSPPAVAADETVFFCENTTATLNADIEDMRYLWNTGATTKTIEASVAGEYTVLVTDANTCSSTRRITLETLFIPEITNIVSDGTAIIVSTKATVNSEFSLDGITYQNSPVFEVVSTGNYTIYVKGKIDCGIVQQSFFHISVPKFFTPNGDGVNDFFIIEGLDLFDFANVSIFDRYGALLRQDNAPLFTWDGTILGRKMPNNDYWYSITTNQGVYRGNFSLKR